MKATVEHASYHGGYYVRISHETPFMSMSHWFPSKEDADAVAAWFNYALESYVAEAVRIWRPVQSLSDDIYGTKSKD